MFEIDRSALIVLPGEPYVDWINATDPEEREHSLEEIAVDPSVYLVREVVDEDDALAAVKEIHEEIFEDQLRLWSDDSATWPPERTFEMFIEWFEIVVGSMVLDAVGEPAE